MGGDGDRQTERQTQRGTDEQRGRQTATERKSTRRERGETKRLGAGGGGGERGARGGFSRQKKERELRLSMSMQNYRTLKIYGIKSVDHPCQPLLTDCHTISVHACFAYSKKQFSSSKLASKLHKDLSTLTRIEC